MTKYFLEQTDNNGFTFWLAKSIKGHYGGMLTNNPELARDYSSRDAAETVLKIEQSEGRLLDFIVTEHQF